MTALRLLLLAFLAAGVSGGVRAAEGPATSAATRFDITPLITAGLLDPDAPLASRRELANRLIDAADRSKDPALLYYVGSMYRQGDRQGIAPFAQDLSKAREFLTRAALAGHVDAMGKLAALELEAGNVFDGNLWAQLYTRYARQSGKAMQGVAVALLGRALAQLAAADQPRLLERRNAMIGLHDATIQNHIREGKKPNPHHEAFAGLKMGKAKPVDVEKASKTLGAVNASGMAEYFVEFDPAGKLIKVWPFDAWPSDLFLEWMRPSVDALTVNRAKKDGLDRRITMLPIHFVDPRAKLQPNGFAPSR